MGFQPPGLEQYSAREALTRGTLWKAFYDPYPYPSKRGE